MKVLAKYLPQFHQVRENNAWWGEGFTEWTAVKGAEKLFEEHYQPRVPQNGYYYDLTEYDTMKWQAELMHKYGVDGMCIYHYWFKDGRKILEKPAENLLSWTDIEMPFCFCWANETWARSWSGIKDANRWADAYEQDDKTSSNGILLEQKYGTEKQWKEHFEYLLPFFRDERYIKVDGKPLFLIYKTAEISCLAEMLDCWRRLANECGLNGIYIIGSQCNESGKSCIDAELYHQPARSLGEISSSNMYRRGGVKVWEYDDIWNGILTAEALGSVFFEGAVGFDDTPRRGSAGTVIIHGLPEKFAYYLTELMAKNAAYGNDITFINAWNEWGEGMYLEPDEKYGDRYLCAISYAKKNYRDRIEKYRKAKMAAENDNFSKLNELKKAIDKDRHYLRLLDNWMIMRENGFSVADWLIYSGYQRIAVYGYGILGKHLCRELCGSAVDMQYIIDWQGSQLLTDYKVYLPSDELPETDLVLVSATYDYDGIYHYLKDKGIHTIISLQTILCEN